MLLASGALALFALVLAWPAPLLLAAARWPMRAPATALLLWQAIALAGGLSMIGSLLVFGLAPFGNDLVRGLLGFGAHLLAGELPPGASFPQLFALSGAVLLGIHLLLNLVMTVYRTERARRRHADLLALLSSPYPQHPRTRLLESEAPVAYCLPGTVRSITVLSDGLVARLQPNQLQAVIEHERTHARQRHHLVLIAFRAWRSALPWFPVTRLAYRAVALLIELLADDHARRVTTDRELRETIELVARGHLFAETPEAALPEDALAWSTAARVARLDGDDTPLPFVAQGLVVSASAALLAVPTVLLLLPALS